jgi:DNA-binding NtrC family response regulator
MKNPGGRSGSSRLGRGRPFGAEAARRCSDMERRSKGTHKEDPVKTRSSQLHRILVVEDDEDMQENLRRILVGSGYEVRLARNGAEAVTLLESQLFHLILTDLVMPTMGGLQLLTELRRRERNLPVVFLTAFGDRHTYMKATEMGAVEFLTKPFRADFLLDLIQKILADHPGS